MAAASDLLKPYDGRLMRCYPVSRRINNVANDDEECSHPVEGAEVQNRLSVGLRPLYVPRLLRQLMKSAVVHSDPRSSVGKPVG